MNRLGCAVLIFCCVAVTVMAGPDNNPLNAGATQARNAGGASLDAAYGNPALLGVDRVPRGGYYLLPTSIAYWSDKLAVSPFYQYWNVTDMKATSRLMASVFEESFGLEGMNEEEVSAKLTEELKGGVSLFTGMRTSLLSASTHGFALNVQTNMDQEVRISEGLLLPVFSNTDGLLRGNTLDFSDFYVNALWTTEISAKLGLPVTIPALHDLFRLKNGAGGVGAKLILGHSIMQAEAKSGSHFTYNEETNKWDMDGEVEIMTAGSGFSGDWNYEKTFGPVHGQGIGFDIGGILYDDDHSVSIDVQNLGLIFWGRDAHKATYPFKKEGADVMDFFEPVEETFDRNNDEYFPDERDSLKPVDYFVTFLPLSFNIGYSYLYDMSDKEDLVYYSKYLSGGVNYEQQLVKTAGRSSYVPRFTFGGEAGLLHGVLPVRAGMVLGGSEKFASALGASLNFKYVSIDASYKALGSMIFLPRRGAELSGGISFRWGMKTDKDKDGILDKVDECPEIPEDFDGFEDEDGCPDYDNDNDGIPDTLDQCMNDPEDPDGFEDGDGCPDYDNDNDGYPDTLDKCPDEPEDFDEFEDEDGCPDYDNDNDGVPDTLDQCINEPEDLDGFQDEDGCPDYDNDKDGIPDSTDQCPNSAEDFNGIEDEDGCPEDDRDGDGIHDGIDLCPDEPEDQDGYQDDDGCPDPDNDSDGIPDTLDQCPDEPEDKDGFEDEDGCPDPDNDGDKVCDAWVSEQGLEDKYADVCSGSDECPEKPETHNGYKDEDGCPDTLMKPTEKETKELNTSLRAINFKTASAELMSASHAALDYVVKFLKQYPHLRYEIQGHTDSQGKEEYNLLLSAARAASVRNYLLSKGVPSDRLIAIGYGEGVPVADNTTAAGRAANRRVEFVIIETPEQYQNLKKLEADFKSRIGKAKIKGFR
ncbi:MAG: DUF5723 family protein [Chitinispirillaceae bacterium]